MSIIWISLIVYVIVGLMCLATQWAKYKDIESPFKEDTVMMLYIIPLIPGLNGLVLFFNIVEYLLTN